MANMYPTLNELLQRNSSIHASHQAPPTLATMAEQNIQFTKTLIVACADPRADPGYFFSLNPGEAVIARSAGGQVAPLLNDIVSLDTILTLDTIIVVHHTDCGALIMNPDKTKEIVKKRNPDIENIEHQHWTGFRDPAESVEQDIKYLKASKIIREDLKAGISGYVYDITTGKLSHVTA